MARRKKGFPIHGWLVIDKAEGLTSTHVVTQAKRCFQAQKCGHAGTLDPLATGILPLAFGEATKTVPYLVDAQKCYRFTVCWGAETSTDDLEGEITHTSEVRPTLSDIQTVLPQFLGEVSQVPPLYSAIKVDGQRAYTLAREAQTFELKPRRVVISQLDVIDHHEDQSVFTITCGKGTYIRSLARDMGRALGCFGHIIQLRRTRVGPFDETQALSVHKMLEKVEKLRHSASNFEYTPDFSDLLLPVHAALDDIPALHVSEQEAQDLRQGRRIDLIGPKASQTGLCYAVFQGHLVAIGTAEHGHYRPTRVFHITY